MRIIHKNSSSQWSKIFSEFIMKMLTFAYYVSRGFFCRSFPSLTSGQHESMGDSLCLLSSAVGHSDS